MNFLNFLAKKGVITPESIPVVEQYVVSGQGNADDFLVSNGINVSDLLKLKGEYHNIPVRVLDDQRIPSEVLKYIPQESAEHYKFIPLGVVDGVLEVGIVDPENLESTDALQFISSKIGKPFKLFLISEASLREVLGNYNEISGEVGKALTEMGSSDSENVKLIKQVSPEKEEQKQNETIVEDAPVTKMVAVILRHATEGNASDIHIENMGEKIRVRFRVDGTLYTSLFLPAAVHPAIVYRIKILAKLK